jgi:hypothetical protein
MKIRHLLFLFTIVLLLATAGAAGDLPLEKTLPLTPPLPPMEQPSALGLVVLGLVFAHVCVPLFIIGYMIFGWVVMKLFKTNPMTLAMGVMQRGGLGAFKKIGAVLGILIVLPAGFLGLRWAARVLDHPLDTGTTWVFGFGISVVTAIVCLAFFKAVMRRVKQHFAGQMGGLGGMSGMMGGFGQAPFGEKPVKQAKRGQRPQDRKKLR